MTPTVDIEVFAPGQWAGISWTTKHLDAMVENFAKVQHGIKPPVKLGHEDRQILAQKDGQPAIGWVQGLKRVGSKLVATIADMPDLLRDLLQKRRYDRVSAEIYPHFEDTNAERNLKTGATGPVLCGVALLGADAPEVSTLEDLHRLLATADGDVVVAYSATADEAVSASAIEDPAPLLGEVRSRRPKSPPREIVPMAEKNTDPKVDVEALQAQLEAEKAERVKLSEQVTTFAAVKAQNEEMAAQIKALQDANAAQARKTLETQASEFITRHSTKENYRITPGMKPLVAALFTRVGDEPCMTGENVKVCFGADTKRTEASAKDLLVALIEAIPTIALGETAQATTTANAGDDFGDAVREMATKNRLDVTQPSDWNKAVRLTMAAREDLVPDYTAGRLAKRS